jgi:protein-S-isoprenylcysteine O-methyltransferase Ste14
MTELVTFVVLTALLLVFTLQRPFRHRFYRFFVFESVIGLVLRGARVWFLDPFSLFQIFSWLFLGGSIFLAVHAVRLLKVVGAPDGDIENTTRLVSQGAYRYIRHPLYSSLLLLGVGAFLKQLDLVNVVVLGALVVFVVATASVEEQENLERFGQAYRCYMDKTKRFIPAIY